jgi:hypothetical protein
MRILHCLRAPVGGLFRHVLDLAEEQAKRGHDVGILAARTEDSLTASKLAALAPILSLGVHRIAINRQPKRRSRSGLSTIFITSKTGAYFWTSLFSSRRLFLC